MKKIKISENKLRSLISEELKKTDIVSVIKSDKDVEKRIKEIASEVIVSLFKMLWQHRSFYDKAITRG
jgi:uncharacterized FlaG/YvyC family protein